MHSGKEDARAHRKALNAEVTSLLDQTQALYKQLDKIIQAKVAQKALEASSSSNVINENTAATSSDSDSEAPLEREEIAKLLLLVSKASQNGYVTEEQKG